MKKIFTLFFVLLFVNLLTYAVDLTVTGSFPSNSWDNTNASYKMTEIGTTGIFSLEKTLPAGTYEYKVFFSGTWNGPTDGDNRKFVLDAEKTVKFYAKSNGTNIWFFSDAQQLYVIGAVVGGWDVANMKLMTNSTTDAKYTADVVAGNCKIVVKDKNDAIVWNDITPTDQIVGGTGNYTIKFDFTTFTFSAESNSTVIPAISTISNSYIFVGQDPTSAAWYNGSATFQTENFNTKNLGSVTNPIYLGGEILTAPVMNGVTVKMYYQIDDLAVKEIILPFESNDGTTNTKWKSTAGTNVFDGFSLVKAQTYSLKVWFSATDGTVTLWDSNNMANYVATFTYDLGTGLNPTENQISITTQNGLLSTTFSGNANIELFNFSGQLIQSGNFNEQFSKQLNNGIYILKLNGISHKVIVK